MKLAAIFASVVGLLSAQTAQAAAPAISGTYLVNITNVCQILGTPTGAYFYAGNYEQFSGIATFPTTLGVAGKMSLTATITFGSLWEPNATGGALTVTPYNLSKIPYKNTVTMLTLGGQVWQISYGTVTAGVAQQFVATGIDNANAGETSPQCVQNMSAARIQS